MYIFVLRNCTIVIIVYHGKFYLLGRPYLISLKLQCNGNKNYSVQVNLEGSEGIIDFKIKHACGTVTAWYHSAFTDKSIGKLEWSHFMVEYMYICFGFRKYITRLLSFGSQWCYVEFEFLLHLLSLKCLIIILLNV